MKELEQSIQQYFGELSREELHTIVSLFETESMQKGEYFVKAGRRCDKLSFVRSGFLRIFVETDRKEVTQWISAKDSFLTDLSSLVFETPARWNIQALTDTELVTLNRKDYKRLENLLPRWSVLEKLFIARCFTMLEDRIFTHLSMTAEERYRFFFERNKELFSQVPLQYIASMLGMTPETFSRVRNKTASLNS